MASTGPRTYRELKALVTDAATQGYSLERGEITEGLASVGVVVKDHIGWPAAGIAVTFSAAGLNTPDAFKERIDSLLPEMTATAHELSRRIHGAS